MNAYTFANKGRSKGWPPGVFTKRLPVVKWEQRKNLYGKQANGMSAFGRRRSRHSVSLQHKTNQAFQAKLLWRLLPCTDSLWCDVMRAKSFHHGNPDGCGKEEFFLFHSMKKFAIVNRIKAVSKNKGASQARKANKAIARTTRRNWSIRRYREQQAANFNVF